MCLKLKDKTQYSTLKWGVGGGAYKGWEAYTEVVGLTVYMGVVVYT